MCPKRGEEGSSHCGCRQNCHHGLGFNWGGSQVRTPSAFRTSTSRKAARVMLFLAARAPLEAVENHEYDEPCGRAKRPARARRPAAMRQRVLNSDLQRRPPPGGVAGCGDCLELVAEDLKNHDWYRSGCLLPGSRRF